MNDRERTPSTARDQALTDLRGRLAAALAETAGNARAQSAVLVRTHVAALRELRREFDRQIDRTLSMYAELERWPDSGEPPKIAATFERVLREQDVLDHPGSCQGCVACDARRVLEDRFGAAFSVQTLLDEALTVAAGASNTPDGRIAVEHFFECLDGVVVNESAEARVYQAALAALEGREVQS